MAGKWSATIAAIKHGDCDNFWRDAIAYSQTLSNSWPDSNANANSIADANTYAGANTYADSNSNSCSHA